MKTFSDIDSYIASFPEETQQQLHKMRAIILKAAPKAEEKISYGIPTFVLHGNLVHFGGAKNHIGFYPGSAGVANFEDDLIKYNTSKGTIQFPLDKQLPAALITRIVKFRIKQNEEKAASKISKKKK